MGMEKQRCSKFGIFPRYDDTFNGTWSLCAYMVAPWHDIPSCGCNPFPEHSCMYLINPSWLTLTLFST